MEGECRGRSRPQGRSPSWRPRPKQSPLPTSACEASLNALPHFPDGQTGQVTSKAVQRDSRFLDSASLPYWAPSGPDPVSSGAWLGLLFR